MTTYLVNCGMPITTVGIWKGVSSLMGLFGTVVSFSGRVLTSFRSGLLVPSRLSQFLSIALLVLYLSFSSQLLLVSSIHHPC